MSKTFILDAGHGGYDSGAINYDRKLKESDVVLDVCLRVKKKLQHDKRVDLQLTRTSDVFISLGGRAKFANDRKAFMFLSVHCNSADRPAEGFEAFTSPGNTGADEPASNLIDAFQQKFPDQSLRADWSDGDADKEAQFTVLTKTKCPAVLLELAFIHTEAGYHFLSSNENRDSMAQVIANWILTEATK